ncbi:MAG: hypothetical protein CL677_07455 [Bdellovibrionaceae bacterium]|nr:hypothetical protein [Pseudobdellovibrionaceae bacterium]|tara:strand:+ start:50369 stop:51421 length:1053 start_codon:yes stop_codon:yes gene_type:complete
MRFTLTLIIFLMSTSVFAQNKANPDLSLNTLFTIRGGSEGNAADAEAANGFALQEAELRLTSNIDTYFRGDVILAVESEDGEYVVEPEEVFIDTLQIPSVTLRLGKFYPYWGRSNQWHTHAQPFIDAPQTREAIFGEEGFNETGLAVSYLLPTPWYFEVVAQAFSAENTAVFGSDTQDDLAGVYFVKNLWDLSDSSTLELDLGYASGKDVLFQSNDVYNAALTYKKKYADARAFIWTAEYTQARKRFVEDEDNPGTYLSNDGLSALSTWLQYQFQKRWWGQLRYEAVSNLDDSSVDDITKSSALVAFVPSEFSAIRLQYDNIDDPSADEAEQRVTLQLNLTMGAHPAHDY